MNHNLKTTQLVTAPVDEGTRDAECVRTWRQDPPALRHGGEGPRVAGPPQPRRLLSRLPRSGPRPRLRGKAAGVATDGEKPGNSESESLRGPPAPPQAAWWGHRRLAHRTCPQPFRGGPVPGGPFPPCFSSPSIPEDALPAGVEASLPSTATRLPRGLRALRAPGCSLHHSPACASLTCVQGTPPCHPLQPGNTATKCPCVVLQVPAVRQHPLRLEPGGTAASAQRPLNNPPRTLPTWGGSPQSPPRRPVRSPLSVHVRPLNPASPG